MSGRIGDHSDPDYRQRNPSPHCAVWDFGTVTKQQAIHERFVYLCDFDDRYATVAKPVLETFNILEQYVTLILQTLRRQSSKVFLPGSAMTPAAGRHLKVAIPLIQSSGSATTSKNDVLDQIYHDNDHDPIIQATFNLMRQYFHNLRYSANPAEREYYKQRMQEGAAGRLATGQKKQRYKLLVQGAYVKVQDIGGIGFQFFIWNIRFNFLQTAARLSDKTTVWMKYELTEYGQEHEVYFTAGAYGGTATAHLVARHAFSVERRYKVCNATFQHTEHAL